MNGAPNLIVVSNRLPITISCVGDQAHVRPSSGGLVTALEPVLSSLPATWIGWTGTDYAPAVERGIVELNPKYNMVPVYLTETEKEKYYLGFANQVLWPLCHDMQTRCNFDPSFWPAYQAVNEKFADQVTEIAMAGDLVWVHDYHLMLVGQHLRRRHPGVRVAYFHHIPFPAPDMFAALPSGQAILRALLCFDHIGFQTENDKHNFVACIRGAYGKKVKLRGIGSTLSVQFEGSCSAIAASPISIDSAEFRRIASSEKVTDRLRELRASFGARRIILGIDRLDYTKGILQKLMAFRFMLARHPELHGDVVLLQVLVPSREDVPEYRALRIEIEQQISEINGTFGKPDWTPIVYLHRNVACSELVALYRLASVMAVTSLKDGMNLVAKEYCACNLDRSGSLVLSKFTGAAHELRVGAFIINPNDVEELADAYFAALRMNSVEARRRMAAMQSVVSQRDVWHWLASVTGTTDNPKLPVVVSLEELTEAGAVA